MNKNKYKIILPVEVKNRELISRLLLGLNLLTRLDCEIIIGSQRDLGNYYQNMKNCLYLDKSISVKKFDFIKQISKNNDYFSLDEEGSYFWFEDMTFHLRFSKKLLALVDKILLWGKIDELLLKKKKLLNNKKFLVFGNPKFELLKKPFNIFYEKEKKFLTKKYGKYILCVSSFVLYCDGIRDPAASENFIKRNYLKAKTDKRKYEKFIKDKRSYENYLYFIDRCKNLATSNPDKIVIFRPHPFQDINLVKKRFLRKPKNLKIIYNNELTPWIMGCDFYVHAGCTSVLEAYFLKKKILNFTKKQFLKRHFIFEKISKPLLKNKNIKLTNNFGKNGIINKKFFSEMIFNYDNHDNYEQLIKIIKKNLHKNSIFFKDNFFQRYSKSLILKIQKFNQRSYFTKQYLDQKLKIIKFSEIKSKVNLFEKIKKDKNFFKVEQFDNNLFRISRSNSN